MEHVFKGLGLEVQFPFEPYGVQKCMINSVTSTLTNKTHCLIESPTGTGKTLVLLCSALAWQKKSKLDGQPFISVKLRQQRAIERLEKLKNKPCTCGRRQPAESLDQQQLKKEKDGKCCRKNDFYNRDDQDDEDDLKKNINQQPKTNDNNNKKTSDEVEVISIDSPADVFDDDDVQVISTNQNENKPDCKPDIGRNDCSLTKETDICEEDGKQSQENLTPLCRWCAALAAEEMYSEVMGSHAANKLGAKVPRIFYGTRTHKQISQVVRELNKTHYKDKLRMCILSSRERTCINDSVKDQSNRNDLCQELISKRQKNSTMKKARPPSDETCPYYSESNSVASMFDEINNEFVDKAWDIEDAAKFGKTNRVCPYYGTRSIQDSADITFCPYNYLLDPIIRKTLNINLNNAIIIVDEAHNIEDICRDSASFTINTSQIDDMLESIQVASNMYVQGTDIADAYTSLKHLFGHMKRRLTNTTFNQTESNNSTQTQIIPTKCTKSELEEFSLSRTDLAAFKENLKILKGDDEENGEKSGKQSVDSDQRALNSIQMSFVTQLAHTLDFIYGNNFKHIDDYRVVLSKYVEREFGKSNSRSNYRANKQKDPANDRQIWQFSLLCMNPAVAFEKVHSSAWSVIVASGTLSPIESLKTELGCKFANVFEGAHVIKEDRIFAAVLAVGRDNIDLNCAFTNSLKLEFQDEVGRIISDICATVPNGVLCFFPSYDRMESFRQRWFAKGIISDIQKSGKKMYSEKKNVSVSDFEEELDKYNKAARGKGAVLFAVFRGKVSEGIDFADKAARAVITIGIPYPNVKDVNVGLKKEYNDIARAIRPQLMTGGDWYATQAFRALNQALGRCVRHKNDWGAVLMIDSRLAYQQKNISRWIQKVMSNARNFTTIHERVKEFVATRTVED